MESKEVHGGYTDRAAMREGDNQETAACLKPRDTNVLKQKDRSGMSNTADRSIRERLRTVVG